MPHATTPPPFDYADGEELRSRMHQLAFSLHMLDRDLTDEYEEGGPFRKSVTSRLHDIERIAEGLQEGDLSTRHPFLIEDMDRFLRSVRMAQREASRSRYYMAGRVAGACVSCHLSNY